ncbi:hypothetical protein EJB05_44653 [Eragrostis curvula]|uniref:Uncharacterized protein n=1 Tax=Eragrostis curvula TaxID=38414 RepID=A0A5J9TI85_9POAL|nr:hypothetical protein EJB05_44653 [Eragrostis curvula]
MKVLVAAEGGLPSDTPEIVEIIEALKLDVPNAMDAAVQAYSVYASATKSGFTIAVLLCNNGYLSNHMTEWRGEACIANLHGDQDCATLKSGSVTISVETAAQQAELRGHSLLDEVRVLLVHGILQLLCLHEKTCDGAETEVQIEEKLVLETLNWKTLDGQALSRLHEQPLHGPLADVHKGAGRFYHPKYKYIFCDMDGVLFYSTYLRTEARPAVIKVLGKVKLSGTQGIVSESSPGVFLQGLLVYGEGGKKIHQVNLDIGVAREALLYSVENRICLVAFSEDDCYTMFNHPLVDFFHVVYHEPKAKIISDVDLFLTTVDIQKVVFLENPEVISSVLRPYWANEVDGKAQVVQAQRDVLEIVPLGTSKGKGVKILLESLGASPDQVMAIGDGENDKEMLQLAGLGVALSNGCEVTKSVADVICASNDESGVAQAIYKYL